MGSGLQPYESGHHFAFCAGTGVLVFLDLVAHLLIMNCFEADGKGLPEEMEQFYDKDFKLHLFVAFQSKDQSIGLELIEALERVNKVLGVDNFQAYVRFSETEGPKMPRWTPGFVESALEMYSGEIKKVWVCGPP